MAGPAALNLIDIDGEEDEETLRDFGRDYHDDRSWEDLQEDEFGNLHSIAEASEHAARRRRLLSSTVGARVRRGMIRYLQLVVDLSKAASLTDMRPVRSAIMFHVVQQFIRAFFDANPLSQLGIIVLRNGVAERLTELSSSPEVHIQKLKSSLDTAGAASLQNGLDLAVESLRRIPPYGHREVLVLLAALSSCDPGNILDSIKAAKSNKVRVSVVGLAAEVHVCRVAATETGGSYDVATSEAHLEQIMIDQATPPPAAPGSSGVSLVKMGFPAKASSALGAASFIGSTCELHPGAFICPRCKARVDSLPAECHVCGLTLVSSPHLARSYHHLFPVRAFEEVSLEILEKEEGIVQGSGGIITRNSSGMHIGSKMEEDGASSASTSRELPLPGLENKIFCYGCSSILEAPPVPRLQTSGRQISRPPGAVSTAASTLVLRCPDCRRLFCLDCDAYVHEQLHSCPGCECLPVREQENFVTRRVCEGCEDFFAAVVSMTSKDLKIIPWVLAGLFLFSTAHARLLPSGGVWIQRFDPPSSDQTLMLQLRVYDWWNGDEEKVVVPKGTKYPIVDDSCSGDTTKCPSWALPSDVELTFGPETRQDSHRISIFFADTGTRVPIYSAPYERATSGCSGQAGSVCCGGNEYTLIRDEEQYRVIKLWVSRFNGTSSFAGNQPENFRSYKARFTVRAGSYTGSVVWKNMFQQRAAEPQPGGNGIKGSMSFLSDSSKDVIHDVGFYLTQNYTLLLPVNDPKASGFVVRNDQMNEQPAPLSMDTWRACRTSRCSSAPPNFCKGTQGPTPYASWRTTTTAKIIADGWNIGGLPNYKTCTVLGNGRKQYMNSDLTMGESHDAQFINCTHTGTSIIPIVTVPRAALESGTPPPSLSPAPASPTPVSSPSPSSSSSSSPSSKSPSPTSPQTTSAAQTAAPPPPVPLDQANGPAISLVVTLPTYTTNEFNSTGKAALLNALKKNAWGATTTPYIRYRIIAPATTVGTTVDCVVYFTKSDRLWAGLLQTNLEEKPETVFPASDFGAAKVTRARMLGCVIPCGPNGAPGPVTYPDRPDVVACSCECDAGWSTQPNQNFDTWVYCMVKAPTPSSSTNSTNSTTTTGGDGTGTNSGGSTGSDRVPKYPPPPPIQFDDSNGGISAGAIVGILVALFFVGILVYLVWRTGCTCCCAVYSSCFTFFWHRCLPKKKEEAEEDVDIEAAVTKKKTAAAGKGAAAKLKEKEAAAVKSKKKVRKNQTQPTEDEDEPEEEEEQEEDVEQQQEEESEESEEESDDDEEEEEESEEENDDEELVSPRSTKKEKSSSSSPKSNQSSTKKKKKKKKPNSSGGGKRRHKQKSNPFD